MDTRGAVDLELAASEINVPGSDVLRSETVARLADDLGFGIPPAVWARLQFARLAAASVLEARLLHVKTSRLEVFHLAPDPSTVTLQQLAPLHLEHNGTAGQAFELAVADAVAAGDSEVTGLIRSGLRALGLSGEGPLHMVVLGIEKVPLEQRQAFWDRVLDALPRDGKFRTGRAGRPASVATTIEKLATATTQSLQRPRSLDEHQLSNLEWRDRHSQLARADALIACGSDLVAVSMKINPRLSGREAWRDVPLWITAGPDAEISSRNSTGPGLRSPRVTVTLPADGWFAVFRDALDAVDEALKYINLNRPYAMKPIRWPVEPPWFNPSAHFRISHAVARTLWLHRTDTVAEVAALLRQTHPALREATADLQWSPDVVQMTALDVPALLNGWQDASDDGSLFTQDHLFRDLTSKESDLLLAAG